MNRKGFTLIETLVVIVILGLILLIAGPSLLNVYEDSKIKSEEIFTTRLSQSIDSYVKLNSSDISFTSVGTANKTEEGISYQVDIYKGRIIENNIERIIVVNDIIDANLLSIEDYVNAGNKDYINPETNKKSCITSAEIEVYRDSDYVYCYKVKKESLGCLTDRYESSITGDYAIDTCVWGK